MSGAAQPDRDVRADRRFAYARAAMVDKAWLEAADLFEQVLHLAPDWAAAWFGLGEARQAAGDITGALNAFRQALVCDPSDRHGTSLRLAALDPDSRPQQASPAYVEALFDAYARCYDDHLTQDLAYRGPSNCVEALPLTGKRYASHAIDLGCGTGLGGMALRGMAARLTGVDLSSAMIAEARAKAIYDRLVVADIQRFLQSEPASSADLILAADVFVYVGDLKPILDQAARVLEPDGTIAFTVQKSEEGVVVGHDMRFAHAPACIEASLKGCGFPFSVIDEKPTRREQGRDVPGLVVIARRAA